MTEPGSMRDARIHIEASPEVVYAMVSDLPRMGEWSPENQGGEWLNGALGPAVGAKFKGQNKRKGGWSTKVTVTVAEPGKEFALETDKGRTRWRYRFEPSGGGVDVAESFEIVKVPGAVARSLTKVATGVPWEGREDDMQAGMEETLRRLKAAAKAGG